MILGQFTSIKTSETAKLLATTSSKAQLLLFSYDDLRVLYPLILGVLLPHYFDRMENLECNF